MPFANPWTLKVVVRPDETGGSCIVFINLPKASNTKQFKNLFEI